MEVLAVEVVCMCVTPYFVSVFSWMLQESAELTLSALPLSLVVVRCWCSPKSDLIFTYGVSLQHQHHRLRQLGFQIQDFVAVLSCRRKKNGRKKTTLETQH